MPLCVNAKHYKDCHFRDEFYNDDDTFHHVSMGFGSIGIIAQFNY